MYNSKIPFLCKGIESFRRVITSVITYELFNDAMSSEYGLQLPSLGTRCPVYFKTINAVKLHILFIYLFIYTIFIEGNIFSFES